MGEDILVAGEDILGAGDVIVLIGEDTTAVSCLIGEDTTAVSCLIGDVIVLIGEDTTATSCLIGDVIVLIGEDTTAVSCLIGDVIVLMGEALSSTTGFIEGGITGIGGKTLESTTTPFTTISVVSLGDKGRRTILDGICGVGTLTGKLLFNVGIGLVLAEGGINGRFPLKALGAVIALCCTIVLGSKLVDLADVGLLIPLGGNSP